MLNPTQVKIIEPPKARPRRPAWERLHKNRFYTLEEAIALSMNVTPSSLRDYLGNSDKALKKYNFRLAISRSEAHEKGAIEVVDEGKKNDKSDWVVRISSFVNFAVEREWSSLPDGFKRFSPETATQAKAAESKTVKTKASNSFLPDLVRILTEIANRAGKNGVDFSVKRMPGIKRDLLALINNGKYYRQPIEESTLDGYVQGFCQFKGRRSDLAFYKRLFPEHFPDKE